MMVASGNSKEPPGFTGIVTDPVGVVAFTSVVMLATLIAGGRPTGNTGAKTVGETRMPVGVIAPV